MRIQEITESEDTDHADRIEANEACDRIQEYLTKHADWLEDVLSPSTALGGSFVLRASKVGVGNPDDDLLIIFAPNLGEKRGAFGHAGRHPLIVLSILKGPSDFKYLETRMSGGRTIFVHEYMHYLSWSRKRTDPKTPDHALTKSYDSYYNHADELNAYYQECVSSFYRMVYNMIDWGHEDAALDMFGSKSTQVLVADIMSHHMNKDFVAALTPENRRRIEKRVARFIEQTIRPLFTN